MHDDEPLYALPMRVCYPVRHKDAMMNLGRELRRRGVVSKDDLVPTQSEVDAEADAAVAMHQKKFKTGG